MAAKKAEEQKPGFFSLRNRYLVYVLILIGGIIADAGVLMINAERKELSIFLIVLGGALVFFSLYLITNDQFYIKGYKPIK